MRYTTPWRLHWIVLLSILGLAGSAFAQGAELLPERFTVTRDGHELFLAYDASHDLKREHPEVRHLAVMVHGVLRDGVRYHGFMQRLWEQRGDETLAVLTPQFIAMEEVQEHDLNERWPYWSRGGWSIGHLSRSDDGHERPVRISSFEMFDELLLAAARQFPNLQSMTIAGHSAGGQCINRYAAGNRAEPLLRQRGIDVHYIVSNPSSYVYFCDHRLTCRESFSFGTLDNNDCDNFNRYRYGLENLNAYMTETGRDRLGKQYAGRHVTYLLGEADNNPEANRLDRSCGAMTQGAHRLERGKIYHRYLAYRFGSEVHERHRVVTVPGVGHNAARMFGSDPGQRALFVSPRGN